MIARDPLALRRSHADADVERRRTKARQVLEIIERAVGDLARADVLDIGTGSGIVASVLRQHCRSLVSVDVVDERKARDFEFRLIESEALPFPDSRFDAVISNHVIEHVQDKRAHLAEIRRVLRPEGAAYLAMPNRWAIVEPHLRLPFLSWLPGPFADRYARATGRGPCYDVDPLSFRRLMALAAGAGLTMCDESAVLASAQVERLTGVRQRLTDYLHVLYPSYVVLLTRAGAKQISVPEAAA